ncbi:hypothetical protein F5Y19DRAFT_478041 [Xylariaceae sp. FL1651]|nr:hypothetical protein F5Y19DRAFT_478041 [Xylariaceae sp. FL1651]
MDCLSEDSVCIRRSVAIAVNTTWGNPKLMSAVDTTFAGEPRPINNGSPNQTTVIVVVSVVSGVVFVVLAITIIYFVNRRRSNSIRVEDVEAGSDEQPILLQELPPIRPAGRLYESGNVPEFSRESLPRRRSITAFNFGLNSHPPSEGDLAAAERGYYSNTATGPPSRQLPENSEQERGRPASRRRSHYRCQSSSRPASRSTNHRRHGIIFESSDDDYSFTGDGDTPVRPVRGTLAPSGPGIETMPDIVRHHQRRQQQAIADSVFPPPSTIHEESTPELTEDPSADGISDSERELTQSPNSDDDWQAKGADDGDNDHDHVHNQELGSQEISCEIDHDHYDQDTPYDGGQNCTGEEHTGNADPETPQGGPNFHKDQRGVRRNRDYPNFDGENMDDDKYDVPGAIAKFGKPKFRFIYRPEVDTSRDTSQTRDTDPSLYPAPLNLPRRNQTVHEPSSPLDSNTVRTQHLQRAASSPTAIAALAAASTYRNGEVTAHAKGGTNGDEDVCDSTETVRPRPKSFVIINWPPADTSGANDEISLLRREQLWHQAPTPEIIEQSREARERLEREEQERLQREEQEQQQRAREQLEREELGRRVIALEAEAAGEELTEEEIAARAQAYRRTTPPRVEPPPRRLGDPVGFARPRGAHLFYNANNNNNNNANELTPGPRHPQGPRAPPTPGPAARRAAAPAPTPAPVPATANPTFFPPLNHDNRSALVAPSYPSSQVLPVADTMNSIQAQAGSDFGEEPSPAASPVPSPPPRHPRRRLPRSDEDPDLSRYL